MEDNMRAGLNYQSHLISPSTLQFAEARVSHDLSCFSALLPTCSSQPGLFVR